MYVRYLYSHRRFVTERAMPPLPSRGAREAFPRLPTSWPSYVPRPFFHHEIVHRSKRSRARVGRLHTPHGVVDTPGFVAVGTNGAIKGVPHGQADEAGMQLMFANALHLLIHPGTAIVSQAGGLHRFMGREHGPLITDSGGFQIFSVANRGQLAMPGALAECSSSDHPDDAPDSAEPERSLKSSRPAGALHKYSSATDGWRGAAGSSPVKITEEGAHFRSYRDGEPIFLSPEGSVEAQKSFGADIILPLDDLPGVGVRALTLSESVARTHRWESRSLLAHLADPRKQAMYGIIHGGTDTELRASSIATLCTMPFDGYAVGGSLGVDRAEMLELLAYVMPRLPEEKPNHLLGIGDEDSMRAAVALGVDTFDSCYPTRMGRHGTLLTRAGKLKINKSMYRDDYGRVDEACDGFVSTQHTRAYLHHLWKANEPVVHGLLTLHNLKYMMDMI